MYNVDIFYSNNTLNVCIEGSVNKRNILKIKKRVYYIINKYRIKKIIIDIKNTLTVDKEALSKFLDDYDVDYDLVIIDK